MRPGWKDYPAVSGGCQCGAVRFDIAAGAANATVCHCRMCQRATGNAFAPLYEVESDKIRWSGTPATWASSNLAERGFCATCGTPIFYRGIDRDTTEIMAGTLPPDFAYDPVANHGIEARVGWLDHLGDLPGRETFFDQGEALTSHQTAEPMMAKTGETA